MTPALPTITDRPVRLAVLISGGGTTLANLCREIEAGRLDAEVAAVLCSNAKSHETVRSRQPDIAARTHLVDRKAFDGVGPFSEAAWTHIRDARADLVCLAGFLSLLTIPAEFRHRVINIHPALLPAFGGKGMFGHHVHEAVLAHGCKVSGCTVHFADADYDTGPILVQRTCPVHDTDSPDALAARVFEQECVAYPEAIRLLASGRVALDGRVVRITPHPDADLVEQARELSLTAHAGQERAGTPYYAYHPASVVAILRRHGVDDATTLAGAYLHDTLEDTTISAGDLEQRFGAAVRKLVESLTLSPEEQATTPKKHAALVEHARHFDDRARLIKLADRLHNLSELHLKEPAKRTVYAEATVDLLEALRPYPGAAGEAMAKHIRHLLAWYLPPRADAQSPAGPEAPTR